MTLKNLQKNNKAFVMLFAVTISSILLAIALGVANIALKELKFSTSARDTNEAFFAADTGIEYVLFLDKNPLTYAAPGSWEETIVGLGEDDGAQSCAKIEITKTVSPFSATIVSKGYNVGDGSCDWSNPDRIERELRASY